MILQLRIEVSGELEIYEIISELSISHTIEKASIIDTVMEQEVVTSEQTFDAENPPVMFGKDPEAHAKQFRVFNE